MIHILSESSGDHCQRDEIDGQVTKRLARQWLVHQVYLLLDWNFCKHDVLTLAGSSDKTCSSILDGLYLHNYAGWLVWHSANIVHRMNEVILRRVW